MNHPISALVRCLGLLLLLACVGCAASRPSLEGAWIKVDESFRSEDPPLVKILVDGHFAFGREMRTGDRLWAGGGRYVLDGNRYIETIAYHPLPLLVGETVVFDVLLEEGTWHHHARFEKGGEAFHIDEIWVRRDDPRLQEVEQGNGNRTPAR